MRLKHEPGYPSRKSAPVSTNKSLPLDQFCGRRQGHPRALLQTPLNNDTGQIPSRLTEQRDALKLMQDVLEQLGVRVAFGKGHHDPAHTDPNVRADLEQL